MEILSTGEKIKRARIYQGVTLKELCGDRISISKMSCIENEKIKADEDILLYIAQKLNLNYEDLVQDVREQIIKNIELLKGNFIPIEETGEKINYSLKFAIEYCYYDLAFQLTHKLFKYYMNNDKINEVENITSQYYNLYQSNKSVENMIVYYMDMASFFMKNREYNEAINYYDTILEKVEMFMNEDKVTYTYCAFYKGLCHMLINELDTAYTMVAKAIKNVNEIQEDKVKGRIYHVYANLNILLNKEERDKYLKLAYEYQSSDKFALAKSHGEIAKSYYAVGENEKGKSEINKGIKIFIEIDHIKYVEYLIYCIDVLYQNLEFDFAMELLEEALNLSISSDNERLIERAYYFKGMILQKNKQYIQAEMYMNLSTDKLLKFASKEQRFKRYNEMGELYFNLNELREAVKYFTLAMNLEKKL